MKRELFSEILASEMELATGCTEPAAIALCAAYARERLQGEVAALTVSASVNIIKNAMSAGIPGISYTGIHYAAALGATGGSTARRLQVIDATSQEAREKAVALVHGGQVTIGKADNPEKLYIEVELRSDSGHRAKAVIAAAHTNLVYLEADGVPLLDQSAGGEQRGVTADLIEETLSIRSIYEFVETLDRERDRLEIIQRAIDINMDIAREGTQRRFGLFVGQNIAAARQLGNMSADVVTLAMERTACGIDARMGGASVPVVTNSGSGNQGITATVPVVTAARELDIGEERMFRAVTLSHLMAIYIHCRFGLLSALCGATVAGTGAACGLVYLLGGDLEQIGFAINNMLGCVTGILCDGAKADCAMKVANCVNTAFLSAFMAMDGVSVRPDEGIVERDPVRTIRNFVRLGNEGSPTMDNILLDIMLSKQAHPTQGS